MELIVNNQQPLTAVRDLNTHHMPHAPSSLRLWKQRAAKLRVQILFSAGLYPMPRKTPLKPLYTGKIEGPDYTIENVAIQTLPGFYLCGNLYHPKGKKGPFPAIVKAHGHWEHGRLEVQPDVPKPGPPPEPPAKGQANMAAIGVNLARQGFIVFAYDMLGYNDTCQITNHRQFANTPEDWLWGISAMGLQLWNSIRVVDFLQSLKDVDAKRIGVTGASGGGTQTFLLSAVDERVKVAVPVNMVSASMQGGCLCENGPGLRVGTDNVEIAALTAPRPLLLIAATGDWTKNNPSEEWPAIKLIYDLYGVGANTAVHQFNYQHNYNIESREAMYAWFGKWLLGDADPEHFREEAFDVSTNTMHVWTEENPLPGDAISETQIINFLRNSAEKQALTLMPTDKRSFQKLEKTARPALRISLGLQENGAVPSIDKPARSGGKAVLVVSCSEPESNELEKKLEARGFRSYSLKLSPLIDSRDDSWANFYTCYNQTPVGQRVQSIVSALTALKEHGYKKVAIVGSGAAGLWTLLARGVIEKPVPAIVDMDAFDASDNAYMTRCFAPGLRRAGGIEAAAALGAMEPLCLYNTGRTFNTASIAKAYKVLNTPFEAHKASWTAAQIADWLAEEGTY